MDLIQRALHRFTKIFSKDFHEIIPGLYLGNYHAASLESIEENKFYVIVNSTPNIPFASKKTINIRIPVEDDMSLYSNMMMVKYIQRYLPVIHRYLKSGKKVLIHCRAGVQRSATIVAAYLMRYHKMTIRQAISFIRDKRMIAFRPGPNFLHTLEILASNKKSKD